MVKPVLKKSGKGKGKTGRWPRFARECETPGKGGKSEGTLAETDRTKSPKERGKGRIYTGKNPGIGDKRGEGIEGEANWHEEVKGLNFAVELPRCYS